MNWSQWKKENPNAADMDETGCVVKCYKFVCSNGDKVEVFDAPDKRYAEMLARHNNWIRTREWGWMCPKCMPEWMAEHPRSRAVVGARRAPITSKRLLAGERKGSGNGRKAKPQNLTLGALWEFALNHDKYNDLGERRP